MIRHYLIVCLLGLGPFAPAQPPTSPDAQPPTSPDAQPPTSPDAQPGSTNDTRSSPPPLPISDRASAPASELIHHDDSESSDAGEASGGRIKVNRLPWSVAQAVIEPESGSVLVVHENSSGLSVLHPDVFGSDDPVVGSSVATIDQPHDIAICRTSAGPKFVIRTKRGILFSVDASTLRNSNSIQLGDVSTKNRGILRVGPRSNFVYTNQSAGLNDPSVPTTLVAIDASTDPPTKYEVRGSKRIATSSQFWVADDEHAIVALIDKDHAVYFPMSIGTLGKPGENYLRISPTTREIILGRYADKTDIDRIPILAGPRKSGLLVGRDVWTADGKTMRGTLQFQPTAVFPRAPWVAGIANLGIRIASLHTGATLGTITLPTEMLRGLPHHDAIDEIGLPYGPINAIILPDMRRDRLLVIIGDHVATVPLAIMGLPHVDQDTDVTGRVYDEEYDIDQFALSPDRSKLVTLAGNTDQALSQSVTVYDRKTSEIVATKTFAHQLTSLAAGDDAVYVVDADSLVTRLSPESLQPVAELSFRCQSLAMLDHAHLLADDSRRFVVDAQSPHGRAEPLIDSPTMPPDQRLQHGWLIDGIFRREESGAIGRVGMIYDATDFVATPWGSQMFDFWGLENSDSPAMSLLAERTRETGTLLCPPIRCQTLPVQVSLVQSEQNPDTDSRVEGDQKRLSPTPQVQLTIEIRNLVDGELIEQFPLLREPLRRSARGTRMHLIGNLAFVLHRGRLFEVDFNEIRDRSFPKGPRIDVAQAPLVLPLQRQPLLNYEVFDGTPPFEVSASAITMSGEQDRLPLQPVTSSTSERQFTFRINLEKWLAQNFPVVGKQFDHWFVSSPAYQDEQDSVENLRQYMRERVGRMEIILARPPKGIPVMIGIELRISDANKVSRSYRHQVMVEFPAKPLAEQIEGAKQARLSQTD